jgi:cytochrome P450
MTRRLPPVSTTFHPLNPDDTADPIEPLAELRHRCPMSRPQMDGVPPITLVTRYDDAVEVYRNYRTWGNLGVSVDAERHRTIPPEQLSVIATDPPLHTRIRRLMLTAVAPSAVDQGLEFVASFAKQQTEALPTGEVVDLLPVWTSVIPSAAITHVMGLPLEDRPKFHEWTKTLIRAADATQGNFDYRQVIAEFVSYIANEIDRRRKAPDQFDDVIMRVIEFQDPKGGEFTDAERCQHIITMLLAGNDTTNHLLANLVRRLAEQPATYAKVRRDRSLVRGAVEESLRFDPPQQDFPRRCLHATELAEYDFEPDDVVVLSIMSANHDEDHFPDPDRFDIDRDNAGDHTAFGIGIHQCVGAYLARRSTEIAVNALLDRFARIELAPDWSFHNGGYYRFWGPADLRVILHES